MVRSLLVFTGAFAVLAAACGPNATAAEGQKLRILCGSSMSEPLKKLAPDFEKESGAGVELTFGGCETLLPQVELGAPADVFVGHAPFADKLKEKGLREEQKAVLGALRPTVVVPKGNPKGIHDLRDLARADVKVGLPDARYSTCGEMFENAMTKLQLMDGIRARTVYTSRAHQELATALQTGNVDVVVVWNFIAAMHQDKFETIPVDVEFPAAEVFASTLTHAQQPELARQFVAFLQKDAARQAFASMGYGAVPAQDAPATLTLYCAAGVQKPIDALIALFKSRHPGVQFETLYQGSGALLAQIGLKGAGDLYVAGDDTFMATAKSKGFVEKAERIAVFTPVLVTPLANAKGIASFQDIAKPGIKLGLGDEKVAAVGQTARAYLERLGLWNDAARNIAVTTPTVDQLAIQAASGNLDAAIIWDATAWQFRDRLKIVAQGDEQSRVGVPIGVLRFSQHADLAAAFVQCCLSPEAAEIFKSNGFQVAPRP